MGTGVLWAALLVSLLALARANLITVDQTLYTFRLTQSIAGFNVWTAPATRRIRNTDTAVPSNSRSALSISCAQNELESFQVIIAPTSSFPSFTVSLASFSGVGAAGWIDIGNAQFAAPSPWGQGTLYTITDTTVPVAQGGSIALSSSRPTVVWITLYVPPSGNTAGTTTANLVLTPNGAGALTIPVSLYIFNFALSSTGHFKTLMMSQPLRCPSGPIGCSSVAQLDGWKSVYLQHRMSVRDVAWPAGLNLIAWDCANKVINPQATTSCEYSNGCLSKRYALGQGGTWNGVPYSNWIDQGFASYEVTNSDGGMPDICNIQCGSDYYCSAAYYTEWKNYLTKLYAYMLANGLASKGYYYTQNEPQNWDDYNKAAYICQISKQAAPGLKIAISKGARPEIAENPFYSCPGYDIWMAHLSNYIVPYIWDRQALKGEESWIYSLDSDAPCVVPAGAPAPVCGPTFAPAVSATGENWRENPIANNDGPHYRVMPWIAYTNRITGWGYYKDSVFWDEAWAPVPNPSRPRMSSALLREGLEDYEYLWMANGGYPTVYTRNAMDDTSLSIGFCFHVWNTDPASFHALRHELGRKIEGTRPDFPYLKQLYVHPFGDYNINFMNANGNYAPYTYNSAQWLPLGWDAFDPTRGSGWCSAYQGVPNVIQPSTINFLAYGGSFSTPSSDFLYDNSNSPQDFYFTLQQGTYTVSVGVGWPGVCRGSDTEYVVANGVIVRQFNCTDLPCTCQDVREYSATVTVKGNNLLVMTLGSSYTSFPTGGPSDNSYTILAYMKIKGLSAGPPYTTPPDVTAAPAPTTAAPAPTTKPPTTPPAPTTAAPAPTTAPPAPTTKPPTTPPAPTTAAPAPTTAPPAPTTAPPAPTTAAPSPTTAAPAPTTAAPAPTTAAPAPTTAAPSPTTAGPAPTTAAPSPTTAAPSPTTAAPSPTTAAPSPTTAGPAPTTAPPSPTTAAPSPTTAGPSPTTAAPSPTTAGPAPTTAAPSPTTAAPSPTTAAPSPTTAGPTSSPGPSATPGASTTPDPSATPSATTVDPLVSPTPSPVTSATPSPAATAGTTAPPATTAAPDCKLTLTFTTCVDPAQVIAGFAAAMPAPVPPMSVLSFGSCPADASNAVLTLSVGSADNCDDAAAAQTYVAAVNTSLGGVVQSSAIVGPTTKSGGKSKFPLWIIGVIIGGAVALALIVAGVAWLVHRQSQKAATAGFSSGRAGWGHAMEDLYAQPA